MFSIIYLSENVEFGIKQVLSVVTFLRVKYIFLTSCLHTHARTHARTHRQRQRQAGCFERATYFGAAAGRSPAVSSSSVSEAES